jgi:Zn-dependent protease with chaperone function
MQGIFSRQHGFVCGACSSWPGQLNQITQNIEIVRVWPYDVHMTTVPDRSRVRLPGISSRAYEHPADRSALVALRKLSGFDVMFRRLAGLFNDRSLRLMFLASSVRASEQQFPQLYQAMLDGCYILDLETVPELFISQNPLVNAMTLGADKPFIVITTGMVDLMDAEELRFIIGHELGHVLSGHAVYRTMLFHLINLATRVAWTPISFVIRAVVWGLEEWYRKSELSCDRAGLLAGQDVEAARRALMKTAGGSRISELSHDAFHQQAHEYDAVPDLREGLLKLLQLQGNTHPFAVTRFAELDRWAAEGDYRDILAGNYARREDDASASLGDEINAAAKSYQDSWSRSADPLVGAVRGVADAAASAGQRLFGNFGRRDGDNGGDEDS